MNETAVATVQPPTEDILVLDPTDQVLPEMAWQDIDMSPRARMAFEDYLAMGPTRSVAGLKLFYQQQDQSGEPVPTTSDYQIRDWIQKYDWHELARRWDHEIAEANRNIMRQAAQIVRRRHAYIGMLMQKVGVAELKRIVEQSVELDPGEVRRWIETGIKVEAQAKDLVAEEGGGVIPPSALSQVEEGELVAVVREKIISLRRAGALSAPG